MGLLNTYKSLLRVTIALTLIHTLCSSLQHVPSLLSLLRVHRLPGIRFQRCRSLDFHVHGIMSSLAVAYLMPAPELN
jgi:hypothetical protein